MDRDTDRKNEEPPDGASRLDGAAPSSGAVAQRNAGLSKRAPGRWPSSAPGRSRGVRHGAAWERPRARTGDDGKKRAPKHHRSSRQPKGLVKDQARRRPRRRQLTLGGRSGGQKRPGSRGARRGRARHRRSRLRPGQDWRGARPARDQGGWWPRSGRAGRPGPGRRKGHCRADAGGAGPAWQWQRRPLPRSSHPGSGPACRGRRANRRSWLGPTGESPAPSMRAPPRSHSSGGTASGESKRGGTASGDGEKTGSWLRYAGRGRMDRSQGTAHAAKPISTPARIIVRAPRKSQSSSAPFW